MPADAQNDQIPPIRTFQFDQGGLGELPSSVNLFRGDINSTQKLLSMPGRAPGDGLDVTLTLLYQSNVYHDAMTWNRDAPTGVLGLGWSLPLTFITLDDGAAPTAGTRSYSYSSQGTTTALVQESSTPFLFAMDAELAAQLTDGATVPSAIVSAFAGYGLCLSAQAVVSAVSDTAWTLADDNNQQLFNLTLDGSVLNAWDGGESYQLVSYQFWKILYYPPYERWLIVKEAGQRLSFGGIRPSPSQGYATAEGNSIVWGVRWLASQDAAVWIGPSTVTAGQDQYARAWYLSSTASPWGDSVSYRYNDWARGSDGLIPTVEQRVGSATGLPYTKACYLTGITDVFGRTITLQYGDKLWSDETSESAREYADPHRPAPDTTPNAYQDRYETQFLQSVTVADASGATLFSLSFLFQPRSPAGAAGSPVANVTDNTGSLFGDTCKRLLTGIIMLNADGVSLPGLVFDYYFNAVDAGASPGGLKSITYATGGVATYTYTMQSLDICERSYAVLPPAGDAFAGAQPRVYFGDDYAVTTWYSQSTGALSLQVYTWLGRWVGWQLTDDSILFSDPAGLNLSTLQVVASDGFFALSFEQSGSTVVYLFQRDIARPGQWVAATVNGVASGYNTPTLTYDTSSNPVTLAGGDTFLVVASMNPIAQTYSYDRVTWRWSTASWTLESFSVTNYSYVTACNEYYLLLDTTGAVSLFALTPSLVWTGPSTAQVADFSVSNYAQVALTPADSFVVACNLTTSNTQLLGYTLIFLQWDENYSFQPVTPTTFSFTDRLEPSGQFPTSWIPTVVSNTLVAVAGHVLRFNGQSWLENSTLSVGNPPKGWQQRYAYGPDYALQIIADGANVAAPTASVLSFDPNADCAGWTRNPVPPATSLQVPSAFTSTSNWPSAGGTDYMLLGQNLYFRGAATNWDDVMAANPVADLQAMVNAALGSTDRYVLNAQAVVNEAPQFLAYFVFDTNGSTGDQAAAAVLQNGSAQSPIQTLSSERIYTPAEGGSPGPGMQPGGPSAFAGYPAGNNSFNQATQIILHRYAGQAVTGNIIHYAVTGLTIDDGFGDPQPTSYAPDPTSAACDPSGKVVKYYTSTLYPGTDDPTNPLFGSQINSYLNGLGGVSGADYYNMLDGLLQQTQILNSRGTLLSQTTKEWLIYVTRASDPSDAGALLLNLNGGFVVQVAETKIEDGVTDAQQTSYLSVGFAAPYSGQPVSTTKVTYGGTGAKETFTTTSTFGYEIGHDNTAGSLLALHMLSSVAQSVTEWTRDAIDGSAAETAIAQASATTYASFASALGSNVLVPAREAEFHWAGPDVPPFPFVTYTVGSLPSGWLCSKRIMQYSPFGLATEQADGSGTVQSTLLGTDPALPVALFTNASLADGACAYLGFEAYEAGTGWLIAGAQVVTGDAHTGQNSLSLPAAGTASLRVTITPPNATATYLLGFWYKTDADFVAAEGAGFSAVVSMDGAASTTLQSAFANTGGRWVYQTLGIPLTTGQATLSLTVEASNATASAVLVDDVFVAPLVSHVTVRAYDADNHQVTATTDAAGYTTRTLYDRFQRKIATVGPDEQVRQVLQNFLSRQGSASNDFDPASPNATLSISPDGGGSVETFLTGDSWQDRWQPSAYPADWTRAGGALVHNAAAADTLSWVGFGDAIPATAALFFDVTPTTTLADALGVTFGGGYQITFDPDTGFAFMDPDGASAQAPLASPPELPGQWLLVLGDGVVTFFGDGQLLFSIAITVDLGATISIATGTNLVNFRNLAMFSGPRLALTYLDGTGQPRQTQQLMGDDALISSSVRDALGRTVAVTRVAPARFGADASIPLLGYHPTFVDIAGFRAAMADSWKMAGDVADYYQGQSNGPVARSNDEGYPYYGYRFEDSPRMRQVEQGVPGKDYAIHDLASTTPAQRQTMQMAYAANSNGAFDLPDNYFTDTLVSPVKTQVVALTDSTGRKVGSVLSGSDGTVAGQSLVAAAFAASTSSAESTIAVSQPNSFTTSPQKHASAFTTATIRDPAGRTQQLTGPNSGTTSFLCDPAARLRLVQPAMDPGEQWFVYYKYDPLGRLIEEGMVASAWDQEDLAAKANDPTWPDSTVDYTITRSHNYDGDGNDPTLIGRRVTMVTTNAAPATDPDSGSVTVTETYTYDDARRVLSVTMAVTGAATGNGTVSYVYNNLDQVTKVTYPQGSPLVAAVYSYDDAGRVTGIGTSWDTPTDIASYTYTPDGFVEQELRNGGTLAGTFAYASPGWLTGQSVTVSTIDTTNGAQAAQPSFSLSYAYRADGFVQSRGISIAFSGSEASTTKTTFTYDGQARLLTATVDGRDTGSESVDAYDANGNIWSLTQDETSYAFTCAPGTDQLQSLSVGGGDATAFTYSACGNLTQTATQTLDYDPALNLTCGIAVSSGSTLRFGYDGLGRRALKQVRGAAATLYFGGLGLRPLAISSDGATTALIYGPTGLVAAVADKTYFPLTDHAQTVWGVVDDQNQLVVQFAYRAFGSIVTSSGSGTDILPFRFMGQEWDAETGLYNFGARLYSPDLRRFLSTDSARQTASPYVFVCNNPLMMIDPTGNLSLGGRIGIGVAMAVVTIIGFALSLLSAGTSDEAAAAIDAELAGDEAASWGFDASTLTVTMPVSSAAKTAINLTWQIVTNTAFSIGTSSLQYEIQAGRQFTLKGWAQAVEEGAISGAVFGAASGAYAVTGKILNKITSDVLRMGLKVALNAAEGAASSDVAQILMNAAEHKPWNQGLWLATGVGAIEGIPFGLGDIGTSLEDRTAIRKGAQQAATASRDAGAAVTSATAAGVSRAYRSVTQMLEDAMRGNAELQGLLNQARLNGYGTFNPLV
jgi:RHS repeat-associated protein